jgi:hypothetical protein
VISSAMALGCSEIRIEEHSDGDDQEQIATRSALIASARACVTSWPARLGDRIGVTDCQQSTINNQQSTINNQQSTINNQQSTINNQQSTINDQRSTINNQQSTINNQQSTIGNRQSTGKPVALGRTHSRGK